MNSLNLNNSRCKSEQRLINRLDASKLQLKSDDVYLKNKNQYEYAIDQTFESSYISKSAASRAQDKASNSTALYVVLLILITFLTCMATICLTCLFIRKNFIISSVNLEKHNTQHSRPRSFVFISNSITEFIYKYIFARDDHALSSSSMLNYSEKLDINCMQQKQSKVTNLYEINTKNGMKPVSVVCSQPDSTSSNSDLPATATTTTSSSIGSNNNSPNNLCSTISTNLLTNSKFSSIDGDATSTSEDNFEQEQQSARKFKRSYQHSVVKQGEGVTTNLLIAGSNINNV